MQFLKCLLIILALCLGKGVTSEINWFQDGYLSLPCLEDADMRGGILALPDGTWVRDNPQASLFSTFGSFRELIDNYLDVTRCLMGDPHRWPIDGSFGAGRTISALKHHEPMPHVMRVDFPVGARVAIFGDLHGAFHSLLRTVWSFVEEGIFDTTTLRILPKYQKSFFMVFLGDYVDRGRHGVETIALLLHLKTMNPGNIFMSRGNHEDGPLNGWGHNNLNNELAQKFKGITYGDLQTSLYRVYDSLPAAIFIGTRSATAYSPILNRTATSSTTIPTHILGCHGGIEVGYNPRTLLAKKHHCPETSPFAKETFLQDSEHTHGFSCTGHPYLTIDDIPTLRGNNCSLPLGQVLPTGAAVSYSLIHGLGRGKWLKNLSDKEVDLVPANLRPLFKDVGPVALVDDPFQDYHPRTEVQGAPMEIEDPIEIREEDGIVMDTKTSERLEVIHIDLSPDGMLKSIDSEYKKATEEDVIVTGVKRPRDGVAKEDADALVGETPFLGLKEVANKAQKLDTTTGQAEETAPWKPFPHPVGGRYWKKSQLELKVEAGPSSPHSADASGAESDPGEPDGTGKSSTNSSAGTQAVADENNKKQGTKARLLHKLFPTPPAVLDAPVEHTWPANPTGTDPALGFMWSDFLTDDETTPLKNQVGRSLAFGYPLTRVVLDQWGVAGVLRAHQHNDVPDTGPMLTRVREHGGAYNNWRNSSHVVTILSGGHIPNLQFSKDAHTILHITGESLHSWRMEICNRDVVTQKTKEKLLKSEEDHLPELTKLGIDWRAALSKEEAAASVCDTTHAFQCKELTWSLDRRYHVLEGQFSDAREQ